MVKSMTAFTRIEHTDDIGALTLEIRSVNHRFLDLSLRMPEELRAQEQAIRETVSKRVARGKVDINLRFQRAVAAEDELEVNTELAEKIAKASRKVDGLLYNPAPVSSIEVLRWPGVLQMQELDKEQLGKSLMSTLGAALDDFIEAREREGEKLAQLMRQRCEALEKVVAEVRQKMPEILEKWREKLRQRLQEAQLELDENRLEQEIVLLAQKTDIDEELDRLRVHIEEVQRVLEQDKPIGRRLDFLMQELNREANTLGSKSIDTATTQASVELKVLIEQMREQVQNIE
ncbi:MAG: YicC/YloC family endoribonuclease [Thioalkalispiraceae bacterium]|jgi:uncharacterized protein (TIGR00255 family)